MKKLIVLIICLCGVAGYGQVVNSSVLNNSQYISGKNQTVVPSNPESGFVRTYIYRDSLHFKNSVKDWNLGKIAYTDTLGYYLLKADTLYFLHQSDLGYINDTLLKHSGHYYSLKDSVKTNMANIAKLQDSIFVHDGHYYSLRDSVRAISSTVNSQWEVTDSELNSLYPVNIGALRWLPDGRIIVGNIPMVRGASGDTTSFAFSIDDRKIIQASMVSDGAGSGVTPEVRIQATMRVLDSIVGAKMRIMGRAHAQIFDATDSVLTDHLRVRTGAVNGYVLKCDALGFASWQMLTNSYKGTWNANTNTPTLSDATGANGDFYFVSVGDTIDLGSGDVIFVTGGTAVHNGSIWEAISPVMAVNSVNSLLGTIQLNLSLTGNTVGITGGTGFDIDDATIIVAINDTLAKHKGHYYTLRDSVVTNITNISKLTDSISKHTGWIYTVRDSLGNVYDSLVKQNGHYYSLRDSVRNLSTQWEVADSELNSLHPVNLGGWRFVADQKLVTVANIPAVHALAGDTLGYRWTVDDQIIFKYYGIADGSGGVTKIELKANGKIITDSTGIELATGARIKKHQSYTNVIQSNADYWDFYKSDGTGKWLSLSYNTESQLSGDWSSDNIRAKTGYKVGNGPIYTGATGTFKDWGYNDVTYKGGIITNVATGATNPIQDSLTKQNGHYYSLRDSVKVQPDWNQSTSTALDYIKNKPTIPGGMVYPSLGLAFSTGSAWTSQPTPTNGYLLIGNGTAWTSSAVPTWNQSTTGQAGYLKSTATTGAMSITGPAALQIRSKTIRDADDTFLELGGSYTPSGTWVWTSATVTWPTFNQNTSGNAGGLSAQYIDWNATSGGNSIANKPTIPAAQVQTDWNATTGLGVLLNKPTIPAAQIQSDWNQTNTGLLDYIKNKPTIPSIAGLVTTNQSTPQTIGATGARMTKIWVTDLTVTNAIDGSVTGHSGSTDYINVGTVSDNQDYRFLLSPTYGNNQAKIYDYSTFTYNPYTTVLTAPFVNSIGGFQKNGVALASVYEATVTVSNAELEYLNSFPKTIVPNPGYGFAIKIISAEVYFTVASAFSGNVHLSLYEGTAVSQANCYSILDATSDKFRSFILTTSAESTGTTILSNQDLKLRTSGGNPTPGNGTLKIFVTYKIITL